MTLATIAWHFCNETVANSRNPSGLVKYWFCTSPVSLGLTELRCENSFQNGCESKNRRSTLSSALFLCVV